MIHGKNDDSHYYHLQFKVYNNYNHLGTYSLQFHYSPQFVQQNAGRQVSVNISTDGSTSGSGTVDFERNELPDHSKLDCLTCDGSGKR